MAASAYGHHRPSNSSHPRGPTTAVPNIPAGTFPPGTLITVGAHKCTIERYLSEGGFAHVYLVRLAKPVDGLDVAVLKRVAVPDKEALGSMRTEVETMKRLKGHRHIVTYIDSHASHLKGGGYEVFLLMEYCSGGGLIDFMNTRLQHRLTEPEVLKIFGDVTEGVACMHYLQPPLLHRDLKVENVLISPNGRYKLCDFGSCSPVKPAPQSVVECRLLEEDIQKHTTLQYRSPEMVDVFRRLSVDEKSDIWALGVLLYKLCYYTTPFEEQGQLAILNANFSFPAYPVFSDRLKALIASMLRENPQKRPNIYQVLKEACYMRSKEVPIKDIYSNRSPHPTAPAEKLLPSLPIQSPPSVVAYEAPRAPEQPLIPEIVPMRRGRPIKAPAPTSSTPHSASTSKTRVSGRSPRVLPTATDPFAALDAKPSSNATQDELSNRFPSVEQFSLLHDSGSKFQFVDSPTAPVDPKKDLGERVAEKLAEKAFGTSPPKPGQRTPLESRDIRSLSRGVTGSYDIGQPVLQEPQTKKPIMVSTGTMTSPSPSPSPKFRYEPSPSMPEVITPTSFSAHERPSEAYISAKFQQRPTLLDVGRSSTHTPVPRAVSSSRPSLEAARTSSAMEIPNTSEPMRSRSANSKPRPHSVYVESNIEFLRDLESPSSQGPSTDGLPPIGGLKLQHSGASISSQRSEHIESNLEFLRAVENEASHDSAISGRSVSSSGGGFVSRHVKRSSLPSISLPKANKLGGKFGDAFRRFERGHGGAEPNRMPSPDNNSLMPTITGSYNTSSDAGDEWEVSSQEIPAEVKRELEKRQLAAEEKRVAAAAAEYKKKIATNPSAAAAESSRERASSIQKRVHTLLNETQRVPAVPKTAEGYGRYTEPEPVSSGSRTPRADAYRSVSRPTTATEVPNRRAEPSSSSRSTASAAAMKIPRKPVASGAAPNPPPKPNKFRTGNARKEDEEDWEQNFAKRYPSLSGLEMVEAVRK